MVDAYPLFAAGRLAFELGADVQTASMVMLQMPGHMQLATLKCGASLLNSRLKVRANYRLVARTDAVSASPYIAARPTICIAAFNVCSARICEAGRRHRCGIAQTRCRPARKMKRK